MKKSIFSLFLILIFSYLSYSQNGWQWVCPFPQGNTLNQVQFVDSQFGYAVGTFGTIMRTKDGGLSWGREYCPTERTLRSVSFTNIYTGFAVGGDYPLGYVIIKTTNSGVNWSLLDSGTSAVLYKVHAITPQIVYCAGTDGMILSTTNGGLNWSTQVSGTTTPLNSIRFINSFSGIAVGDFATVIRTTNGGQNWVPQPVGFNFGTLNDVQYLDSSTVIAVGQTGRITKSTNGGLNWSTQSLDSMVIFTSLSVTNSNVLAAVGYRYLYFSIPVIFTSTDEGVNWQRKLNSTEINYDQLITVSSIDDNNLIAFGIAAYTYKSSNSGNNWYTASNHLTFYPFNSIYMGQNNIGYAVGGDNFFYSVFFKTTDGGNNWFEQYIPTLVGMRQAQFLNDNIIYDLFIFPRQN